VRVVLQRVSRARVTVGGRVLGEIGPGLLVLAAMHAGDADDDLAQMTEKIVSLRIFEDDEGKMNRSLLETGGSILAISQFTLYANCRKGRRPSFIGAAPPDQARDLFERFLARLRGVVQSVQTGEFGAMMDVELTNAGPVTIILDSEDLRAPRRQS
jgi:D-tyrosyl-tRNA(Tyr) deacylase